MPTSRCYNKGCGQEFDSDSNKSCVFHPGEPIFHDAKKKWSCCGKYSTDFSEFLSIKGCALGLHTDVKPVVPLEPKELIQSVDLPQLVSEETPLQVAKFDRPANPSQMTTLKYSIMPSLLEALKDLEVSICKKENEFETDQIKNGTQCFNSGCKSVYEGYSSNSSICLYHPGIAIFHEGAKYWTCCQRKTADFDAFLNQEGCTNGKHNWTRETAMPHNLALSANFTQDVCRFDWFQMPNDVTVNIYAKEVIPETFKIEANEVSLSISFSHGLHKSPFTKSFNLFGVIDPDASSAKILSKKIEIILKKAHPMSWTKLELESPVLTNEK